MNAAHDRRAEQSLAEARLSLEGFLQRLEDFLRILEAPRRGRPGQRARLVAAVRLLCGLYGSQARGDGAGSHLLTRKASNT